MWTFISDTKRVPRTKQRKNALHPVSIICLTHPWWCIFLCLSRPSLCRVLVGFAPTPTSEFTFPFFFCASTMLSLHSIPCKRSSRLRATFTNLPRVTRTEQQQSTTTTTTVGRSDCRTHGGGAHQHKRVISTAGMLVASAEASTLALCVVLCCDSVIVCVRMTITVVRSGPYRRRLREWWISVHLYLENV